MKGKIFWGGLAALVVGLVFLSVQGASARGWMGPMPWASWERPLCCWRNGALTEEQIAKIRDLKRQYLNEVAPLKEKLFSKRLELRRLWCEEKPDEKKILGLQREIANLKALIAEKATEYKLKVLEVVKR